MTSQLVANTRIWSFCYWSDRKCPAGLVTWRAADWLGVMQSVVWTGVGWVILLTHRCHSRVLSLLGEDATAESPVVLRFRYFVLLSRKPAVVAEWSYMSGTSRHCWCSTVTFRPIAKGSSVPSLSDRQSSAVSVIVNRFKRMDPIVKKLK